MLTVEDGSGKSDADAFVSVADCDTYCTARGLTDWTASSDTAGKEAAIRRATTYLSTAFTWKGWRAHQRSQALAWPRSAASDADDYPILSTEVPVEVVRACCEIAAREIVTPGYASPDVNLTERIEIETVGPITTKFAATPMTANAARPVMTLVVDMVGGLLSRSGNNSLVGSAARA